MSGLNNYNGDGVEYTGIHDFENLSDEDKRLVISKAQSGYSFTGILNNEIRSLFLNKIPIIEDVSELVDGNNNSNNKKSSNEGELIIENTRESDLSLMFKYEGQEAFNKLSKIYGNEILLLLDTNSFN